MARDIIHGSVKQALINDGWTITADPYYIDLINDKNKTLAADLAAEKKFEAQRGIEKIIVEIKSFLGTSVLNNFHSALGQYLDYRDSLEENGEEKILYIAVSENIYNKILDLNFLKGRIEKYQLKFIVVNIKTETILKWIN